MANLGVFPFIATTPVGQVRVLLGDTDPVQVGVGDTGTYVLYSDAELEAMVAIFGGSVKRAGAQAIRSAAVAKAMTLGKWRTDDLSVDYAAVAEAMRKAAQDLDDSANGDDIRSSADIFELIFPDQGVCCTCRPEATAFPLMCRCR